MLRNISLVLAATLFLPLALNAQETAYHFVGEPDAKKIASLRDGAISEVKNAVDGIGSFPD